MVKAVFGFCGFTLGLFAILVLFQFYVGGDANFCLPSFDTMMTFYTSANPFNPMAFRFGARVFGNAANIVNQFENIGDFDFFAFVTAVLESLYYMVFMFAGLLIMPFEIIGWLFGLLGSVLSLSTDCYVMGQGSSAFSSVQMLLCTPFQSPCGV